MNKIIFKCIQPPFGDWTFNKEYKGYKLWDDIIVIYDNNLNPMKFPGYRIDEYFNKIN